MPTFGSATFGSGTFSGLTAGRIVAVDDAGVTDLPLIAGMALPLVALDDSGSTDAAALTRHRRVVRVDLVAVTDAVTFNGVPSSAEPLSWPAFQPGAEWIHVRDADLIASTRHGTKTRDWPRASQVAVGGCSVQPYTSAETTEDREYTAIRRRLFAPAGTRLVATSRVVVHGVTYEVDGEPAHWRDLDGRPSHVEAVLKRVEG